MSKLGIDLITKTNDTTDTIVKVDMRPPNMYNVVLHNDNITTIEFVMLVLMSIFHKNLEDAIQLTQHIHNNEKGIAGTYSHEVASQKREETIQISRLNSYPLKCELEVN
jgi:ATP-dependent Clp protease adaptor protein ClpS